MSFRKVLDIFRKRPLVTNVVTFGTTYVAADGAQQVFSRYLLPPQPGMNWRSIANVGIVGVCPTGPFLFYWYRLMDNILPSISRRNVVVKVAIDLTICSYITIAMFYTGMSILEGKEDIYADLKSKFMQTYTVSCAFWLPAQVLNFCFLPPHIRVAYVGVASFVWVNLLCLIKGREDELPSAVDILAIPKSI